jgi:hypothetical protein
MSRITARVALGLAGALIAAPGCIPVGGGAADETDVVTARKKLVIPAPDPAVNVQYGLFVSSDEQTLLVGDHAALGVNIAGNPAGRGQVHVFRRTGTIDEWQPLQVLLPDSPTDSEVHFGERITLSGNLLFVSAHREAGTVIEQGFIYIFTRPGPGQPFTRVGKITEPTPVADHRFGYFTASNGNFLAAATGPDGFGTQVNVWSVQGNGATTFRYSIEIGFRVVDLAMTQAGVLVVVAGPGAQAYNLQQTQATPLLDTALLGSETYERVRSHGNSFALLDTIGGGRIVVANADTVRISGVTTIDVTPDLAGPNGISYRENQHILVSNKDPLRPAVAKYERQGGSWVFAGTIYPPVANRLRDASNFGNGITSNADFVAVGDPGTFPEVGVAYVLSLSPNGALDGAITPFQRLVARDVCGAQCGTESFQSANFGNDVGMAGDVAAATTTEEQTPALHEAAVHIYTRGATNWQHAARFFLGTKTSRAVAVDSGRVFVGEGDFNISTGFSNPAVRVYERVANQWTLVSTMVPSDPGSLQGRMFGGSIAASGDTAVMGSFYAFYVFRRNADGSWSEVQKVQVPGAAATAVPGSVSLSADYLVFGARGDSVVEDGQGAAFVYRRSDWGLEQKLTPQVIAAEDYAFGYAVAVAGNTVMVSAPGGEAGHVEIFERNGSGATPWQKIDQLAPKDGTGVSFGTSMSMTAAGDRVLVSAIGDQLAGFQAGAAYLFTRANGKFDMEHAHILIPPSDGLQGGPLFGFSLHLDGTRAIVGAPATDWNGEFDSGAAYIIERLTDADNDGILALEDCNDNDGVARRCTLQAANLSFEPAPAPQWTADSGSFILDTTQRTDGLTSMRINAGSPRLRGPLFSTRELQQVGSRLALDIRRPTVNGNAVTLFMSAPAFGLFESVVGSIDISAQPAGQWFTVSAPLSAQQRDILLRQNTDVRFHVAFNVGGPNLHIDRLHFTGLFETRTAPPPPTGPFSGTLTVTSDWGSGYCVALRLTNAGTTPTAGWNVTAALNGTTLAQSWNAAFTVNAGVLSIASNQPWNSSIPAGAVHHDVSVGFCANRPSGSTALPVVTAAAPL